MPTGDGVAEYIRVNSNEHFVIGGTENDDTIVSGGGDDAIWGKGGNDTIEAGYGVDKVFGGEGDDIITNAGTDIGEADFLHGNEGNDVIHGGSRPVADLRQPGQGLHRHRARTARRRSAAPATTSFSAATAATSCSATRATTGSKAASASTPSPARTPSCSSTRRIIGHDVLNGGSGDTDYDGESGDDIMFQNSEGIQRSNGMAGFDWAIHKGDASAANSDLGIPIFATQEAFILRDRFDLVEGLSGWKHDDVLTGRVVAVNTRAEATGTAAIPDPDSPLELLLQRPAGRRTSRLINGLAAAGRPSGAGIPVTKVVNGQTVRCWTRMACRSGSS